MVGKVIPAKVGKCMHAQVTAQLHRSCFRR